jgi:N-acetylglucosamine kinase-like BadF-type ATPase
MFAGDDIADDSIQNPRMGGPLIAETAACAAAMIKTADPIRGGMPAHRNSVRHHVWPYAIKRGECTILDAFTMYVLGIDAGGTKTVCLLADDSGRVLAASHGGGANLQASGELEVEKVLHQVMDETLQRYDVRPDAICLGIAGVDRPSDALAVQGIMSRIGLKTRNVVVNDALVALVAGAGEQPGVVIVAGTGSIAYGVDGSRHACRAGGWGYLLGDEGGGFWIGTAALSAVVRQFDGRGPATRLTELVLAQMGVATPSELIHAIYDRGLQRPLVAGLATVVQQAMLAGDAVASHILARAGEELVAAAASVVTRLGMRGDVFPTILAGGIFRAIPALSADVCARMAEIAPRSEVHALEVEPAHGAVILALAAARGSLVLPQYL